MKLTTEAQRSQSIKEEKEKGGTKIPLFPRPLCDLCASVVNDFSYIEFTLYYIHPSS